MGHAGRLVPLMCRCWPKPGADGLGDTDVITAGGGGTDAIAHAENSEVLPAASVAVAVMTSPIGTTSVNTMLPAAPAGPSWRGRPGARPHRCPASQAPAKNRTI